MKNRHIWELYSSKSNSEIVLLGQMVSLHKYCYSPPLSFSSYARYFLCIIICDPCLTKFFSLTKVPSSWPFEWLESIRLRISFSSICNTEFYSPVQTWQLLVQIQSDFLWKCHFLFPYHSWWSPLKHILKCWYLKNCSRGLNFMGPCLLSLYG